MLLSFSRLPVVLTGLCLFAGAARPVTANQNTLGLNDAQVLRMTDSQWTAYYRKHGGGGGARGVYKALVIYANCEKAQNRRELERLPPSIRQRDAQLAAMLQEYSEARGVTGKPGNAGAAHALGARRGMADLLRELLTEQAKRQGKHGASASEEDRRRQEQAAKIAARFAAQNADNVASQTRDKIVQLAESWPSAEKLLVLKYLEERSDNL